MHVDFLLNGWLVQPSLNRISKDNRQIRLEPKVMQVLEALAERPAEVISRDELVARVWTGVFVTDDVLHRAIRELRRAFDDDAAQPRVIETIRKRGYRLIAPVEHVAPVSRSVPILADDSLHVRPDYVRPAPAAQRSASPGWPVPHWAVAIGVGALAIAAAVLWRTDSVDTESHMRFATVVAGPGNESEPAVSPDGERLAYIVRAAPESGEASHLYLSDIRGSAPRRLTDGRAEYRAPAWSLDGTTLVFSRFNADGTCDVMRLALAGGREHRVRACTNPREPRVDWAQDARHLFVSLAAADVPHRGWQLARLDTTTGDARPLTVPPLGIVGDHSPRLSPDGRLLAFIRTTGGNVSDIYTMLTVGGTPAPLTTDQVDITGFDWTPEGDAIVYSSERAGGYTLWRVPLTGGPSQLVAGGAARMKHPVVSRADGRVIYESWAYDINLWEAPAGEGADDQALSPVTTSSELWSVFPQISPDGTQLAYVSTRSGHYEVWVSARDGSAARQLTNFRRGYTALPRWSPDGRTLVVKAQTEGENDLYLVDVNSGDPRRLTTDAGDEVAPSWSRDGRAIYFGALTGNVWDVWRIDVSTGLREPVTSSGGYAAQESADGRAVYFTRADRAGLWRQPIEGGEATLVHEVMAPGAWANWQVHADGVYLLRSSPEGEVAVVRLDDSGGMEDVAAVPRISWPGFAVAPDGRSVIYARWDRRESNLLALESR